MAPPPTFSGSLQSKRKAELQSLATALDLDTNGTKDDLYTRIQAFLDENQSELEEDPQFSGLFEKRRRRKESAPPPSKRSTGDSSSNRRVVAMEPLYESTPAKDLSDVSAFLKNPVDNASPSPHKRRITRSSLAIADTPSSLPPLPDSPETSTIVDQSVVNRTIIERIPTPRMSGMLQAVKQKQAVAIHNTNKALFNTRIFLSNSKIIWSVSVLIQLVYIYANIVPWQYLHIPFSASTTPAPSDIPPPTVVPSSASSQSWNFISVTIPYPPLATFESRMFWTILVHWFIPTVLIPAIAGILISFKPHPTSPQQVTLSESREISRIVRAEEVEERDEEEIEAQPEKQMLSAPFDPLTASIVQLAAQIAYTFPAYSPFAITSSTSPTFKSVDILGFRWRVLFASVGVAFAFAEAISRAGLLGSIPLDEVSNSKALQPYETIDTVVDSEVD
ncbi:hypothetical protein GYMLUDRAFT_76934 [Collybiopsis luxurians FD-317 M1]|uniref:SAP domain-containing protein n=1 Tax=Collybiopsis luxurians FD-317 M1 TaxID=944289 RepID=A0A0D0AVR1_9AGAR|nr:hypothetical protein GYMLUDRAFT_76934 [Collybiopsis luxurians FD-317 M1]